MTIEVQNDVWTMLKQLSIDTFTRDPLSLVNIWPTSSQQLVESLGNTIDERHGRGTLDRAAGEFQQSQCVPPCHDFERTSRSFYLSAAKMPNKSGFVSFNIDDDIASLAGKVVFITGGTAGLGAASVHAFAQHNPEHIYFSGRNAQAAFKLIDEVKKSTPSASLTFLEMDLSSLTSVHAACKKFTHNRLDILMCNAGIAENPSARSVDGYEIHFATNHLGHAMLIRQLLPVLLNTAMEPDADVRIVILSSRSWIITQKGGILFEKLTTKQDGWWEKNFTYQQSKLANLIYARELAKRFPSITTVSLHPGIVATAMLAGQKPSSTAFMTIENWFRGVSKVAEDEGALNQIWAAAGAKKSELVTGGYYEPVGVLCNNKLNSTAKDEGLAKKLWEWTEEALEKVEP
ncbi:hypothetical protein BKA64DRAFT_667470 [Cadophora sp. MPI-SDFR-AT-0126]|nr:hypothetical protein BKA64DRAFT_667470 [Leotiomycetes sp. MPI-SDFR-AT-0126]